VLGRPLLGIRDVREAIRHLSVAHELFSRLRATPFVERCRLDLRASGMRSSATPDAHVLTERQEDVAALVSRGFTNKEVSRELLVTEKAVEYHLSRIYSKLGVTSRRELRRLRTPSNKRRLTSPLSLPPEKDLCRRCPTGRGSTSALNPERRPHAKRRSEIRTR